MRCCLRYGWRLRIYLGIKLGCVGYLRSSPKRSDRAREHEPRPASDLAAYVQERPGTCTVGPRFEHEVKKDRSYVYFYSRS